MISTKWRRVLGAAVVIGMAAALAARAVASAKPPAEAPAAPRWAPSEAYESRRIDGWTVRVNRGFLRDEPALCGRTLDLLASQLKAVRNAVPAAAVEKLRRVVIWVELDEPHHAAMVYHPDAAWLRAHDMNPDKAGCVEIADARHFLEWSKAQPSMVLHELAHGYHHQFLDRGFANRDVAAAFRRATRAGLYGDVAHASGRKRKAYAATNPQEFFAECTEAFFGRNDFFPFVRAELKEHDPETFAVLERLWGT